MEDAEGKRVPSPIGGGQYGDLSPLLAPRSVAVVGASDREGNLGGVAVGFLKKFGYAGPVWPVNPGRKTVADLPCFPSLRELPSVPDLAILAVPAESMADLEQGHPNREDPVRLIRRARRTFRPSYLRPRERPVRPRPRLMKRA